MINNDILTVKTFDLTTERGVRSIIGFIPSSLLVVLIGYLLKSIFDSRRTETQSQIAESLIKKGKEDGVDEMEITMDNTRGFKFKVPIEGVNVETQLGTDEKMHVKVKYK